MDCSVKQRLLTALNDTVNGMVRAVERLANFAGVNKSDEFVAAHGKVMELRPLVDTARENLENHRREHGC